MPKRETRFRILDDGSLEVVDPGFEDIEILREVNPAFAVARAPIPAAQPIPRFMTLRGIATEIPVAELGAVTRDCLWTAHEAAVRAQVGDGLVLPGAEYANALQVKTEIARRKLAHCDLCARRCGVNRLNGKRGVCGLGPEAIIGEQFVHIGEEPPINPSLIFSMGGCGLRCRFCQQHELLKVKQLKGQRMTSGCWNDLDPRGARTFSFAGGNPDESLYAVLRFLADAPSAWTLPLVWNTHAYSEPEVLSLLNGVVDIYLPDLKYATDRCARRWSGIDEYPEVATKAIGAMLRQNVPVIVRVLVLPGHVECCHLPALRNLARMKHREQLLISVRGQYAPDWKVQPGTHGRLGCRPAADEVQQVQSAACALGLRQVS